MIYLVWFLNLLIALIIALIIRKLFKNKILKRLSFATFLSLLITSWFLYPGSTDIAPILPIYFIDFIESEYFIQMRLVRPFITVFVLILTLDFLIFRYKSKS